MAAEKNNILLLSQVTKTRHRVDTFCVNRALNATRERLTGTPDAHGSVELHLQHCRFCVSYRVFKLWSHVVKNALLCT